MRMLIGCAAIHLLLMNLLPSPWWVPNFTLVGCTLALGRAPRQWLMYSAVAGAAVTMWAIRSPWSVLMSYVIYGGSVAVAAQHWDITDRRIQGLLVGLGSLGMTVEWLMTAGGWSWALIGLAGVHVIMSVLAITCVRYRRSARRSGAGDVLIDAMR